MRMLTPEQCRAARGWFGWTQQELADKAGIGVSTVRAFEAGYRMPVRNNLGAIQRAFEASGVQFLSDGDRATGISVAVLVPQEA